MSAAAYRGWRFENENPEQDLKARGVLDKSALPNYPYREHALVVWAALREYVREYVDLYYTEPHDIANDYELQAFWDDVKQAHSSERGKTLWRSQEMPVVGNNAGPSADD